MITNVFTSNSRTQGVWGGRRAVTGPIPSSGAFPSQNFRPDRKTGSDRIRQNHAARNAYRLLLKFYQKLARQKNVCINVHSNSFKYDYITPKNKQMLHFISK